MLVVQANIPTHNWNIKVSAGIGQALDAFFKQEISFRLVGVCKIQIIRDRKSLGSGAGQVAHAFHKCDLGPAIRIEVTEAIVAIVGDGETLVDPCNTQVHHTRIASRLHSATGHHHMIILPPYPSLGSDSWMPQEFIQSIPNLSLRQFRNRVLFPLPGTDDMSRFAGRLVVDGGFICEGLRWQIRNHHTLVTDNHAFRKSGKDVDCFRKWKRRTS